MKLSDIVIQSHEVWTIYCTICREIALDQFCFLLFPGNDVEYESLFIEDTVEYT